MQTMLRKIGLKQPEIRRLELAMRYFSPSADPVSSNIRRPI